MKLCSVLEGEGLPLLEQVKIIQDKKLVYIRYKKVKIHTEYRKGGYNLKVFEVCRVMCKYNMSWQC
jgi:hypothetical protein